jgi:hypothetical protein
MSSNEPSPLPNNFSADPDVDDERADNEHAESIERADNDLEEAQRRVENARRRIAAAERKYAAYLRGPGRA